MAGECKYCGKYADAAEWPEKFRDAFKPNLCFQCYMEDPSRADDQPAEEEPANPVEAVEEVEDTSEIEEGDEDFPEECEEDPDPTDGDEDPDER